MTLTNKCRQSFLRTQKQSKQKSKSSHFIKILKLKYPNILLLETHP